MAMPLPTPVEPSGRPYWTLDDVRALPDDGHRYELVHGELLVSPSPRKLHQRVLRRLLVQLDAWLATHPVGELFTSPADLTLGPDTLLQPDLFVLNPEAAASREWNTLDEVLLAIEILSPSTARHDRFPKRRAYQEAGVPLYWIVDADARQVETWTPSDAFPRLEAERLTWHPAGAAEPCIIDLPALFA